MYLTYDEYLDHGGDISETDFDLLEFRARKRIDYWTDNRVKSMEEVPEAVKLCMLSIIKFENKFGPDAQADNPLVASFNTDGYSESYGSTSEQAESAESTLYKTVCNMLFGETDDSGTPLLYRGLDL